MASETPEALAFAASHRRRQKTVRLVFVVLIALAGTAVALLWSRVRREPCQKLVDTMCTMGDDCRELRAAFERTGGRIPSDKCAEANKKIEGIEKVPAALRPTMVTNVFAEVFAIQGLRDTIHDALMTMTSSSSTSRSDARRTRT